MLSNKKYLTEKILEPFIKPLAHVSPNVLTLIGIIPSILFFVFVINKFYLLAIIVFLGNFFDFIDGMVARKFNKVTKFGGFLDSTLDRISDFLIISAFGFSGIVRWEIVAPVLLVSFLTSYVRSRGELASPNASFDIGLIKRTERLALTIVALILYLLFPTVMIGNFNIAEIVFIVLLIFSVHTIFQRIIHAYIKS